MLSVNANGNDIEAVTMPSECMHKLRTMERVQRERIESGFYWAIEIVTPKERVAHLIKESERPAYQRPGIRSIIPAYRKG